MKFWLPSLILVLSFFRVTVTESQLLKVKTKEEETDEDLKKYPFSITSTTTTTTSTTTTTTTTQEGKYIISQILVPDQTASKIIQQVIENLERVNEILGKLPDWDPQNNRLLPPVLSSDKTWKKKSDKIRFNKKKIDSFKMIRFK